MWVFFTVKLSVFFLFQEFFVAMNVDSVQFALGWVMRNAVFTIVIWDSRCGVESSRWTSKMGDGDEDGMGRYSIDR